MNASNETKPQPIQRSRSARERQRHRLHRVHRRNHLAYAAVVGIVAGLLAVAFQLSVRFAESFGMSAGQWARDTGFLGVAGIVASTAAVGSIACGLIGRYVPESGGSGIPHIKAAILHLKVVRPIPVIFGKFFGGLAALGVGLSLGREGPTVQMGACIGKLVGQWMKAPRRSRSNLLASGAGAGLAAAFNAPLAGFLFVMEELKREMSAITYGSALVASVCAVGVTRYLIGERPSFLLPTPGSASLLILPYSALLGIGGGFMGVAFNRLLMKTLNMRRKLPMSAWTYGLALGALGGILLIYFPTITGGGHTIAESLLNGRLPMQSVVWWLLVVLVTKLVWTCLSYASGLPGGIFAPILVMGAFLGYSYGLVLKDLGLAGGFSPQGFATLGMAAMLAASVRAPLTGVVLIVEMTAEYGLLYALLVSAFVASLLADALHDKPIYESLMDRDLRLSGVEMHSEEEPILLEVLIEPDSAMDGRRVKHLNLPPGAILATLERGARHVIPSGNTLLSAGDMVTIMIEGDKPNLSVVIHDMAKAPG